MKKKEVQKRQKKKNHRKVQKTSTKKTLFK